MKHRHRARRLAMQGLCCLDVQGVAAMDQAVGFIHDSRDPPEVQELAERMLLGAWAHHEQGDLVIAERSRHWDLRRMPMVDRSILRLAVWELATDSAPDAVVINEAVRLAKEFSTVESPAFVNAVLDAVARMAGKDSPENTSV